MLRATATAQLLTLAIGLRVEWGRVPAGLNEELSLPPGAVAPLPRALRHGLAFIKTLKTGSSSLGAVVRRVGNRRGLAHARDALWMHGEPLKVPLAPAVWAMHGERATVGSDLAKHMPGALFVTIVRNPTTRCLSAFYFFEVLVKGVLPTEANKLRFIKDECPGDSQVKYIQPALGMEVPAIVASYDLVATTERLEESVLLLAKKFGVSQMDVLHLRAKTAGTNIVNDTAHTIVEHPPLNTEPESVQQFLKERFQQSPDAQLHEAANLALDREVAAFGPSFGEELAGFKQRLAVLSAECKPRPWDSNDCFWNDIGCGQDCIDSVAKKLRYDSL